MSFQEMLQEYIQVRVIEIQAAQNKIPNAQHMGICVKTNYKFLR